MKSIAKKLKKEQSSTQYRLDMPKENITIDEKLINYEEEKREEEKYLLQI